MDITSSGSSSESQAMKKRRQDIELTHEEETLTSSDDSEGFYPLKSKSKRRDVPLKMIFGVVFFCLFAFLFIKHESKRSPAASDDITPLPDLEETEEDISPSIADPSRKSSRKEMTLKTSFGSVEIAKFVPATPDASRSMICIHGANAVVDIREEWYRVAEKLAEAGFIVYCPNLHSNDKLAPRSGPSESDISAFVGELMNSENLNKIVLGGKSWGGGKAAHFAHSNAESVSKLVLIAPASASDTVSMPTILLYCKDDGIGRRADSNTITILFKM